MSNYYCHECEINRNRKIDGYEIWNGEPVCENCFTELNACDHALQFFSDTQGDGRDCSYYECAMPDCNLKFYADDIPDDMTKLLNGGC